MALHGHAHKDEFRKGHRTTMSEQFINTARKINNPAPGKYELPKWKVNNIPKSTTDQILMVGDAQWKAHQTPGYKYEAVKGLKYV